ncbi:MULTISPECIES: phosphate ABC transporter substrate-binding protein [unclassified Coleofasciculus]|uniref:phosphate ABC transporter substrate-binding protein n=1 Tax=unclassified Coleofasciculus TaxID=2692782 RepID=UPI00187E94E5|nr:MULTISPECIES: phosphate ABC transporter substrate-binding protein [unclassified Coleofasciculus]MBE9129023.1 phosphate ABC transporter substrate-binding protein [Coleofasciculus sp. LEGE 07081]MBE9147462.1 phosphate ABC transporter substrate-binding protein [Coleofasciculus sp. LEGE 07092]
MSQKNETTVLVLALLITLGVVGVGVWWLTRKSGFNLGILTGGGNNNLPNPSQTVQPTETSSTFPPPQTVPSGTTVSIEGSTSMVQINQALKNSFEQQFPGTMVNGQAGGTDLGIQSVLAGNADIAAISRPLTSQEQSQGLVAVPVMRDAIAIVVGDQNPFRTGLTQAEVVGIFQGQITDWSGVGGQPGMIRVINRPAFSGTHQAFRELVLGGQNFGATPNIVTMQQDVTTPILRELGTDGISYATYAQVKNQRTVRTVAVDGLTAEAPNYPYQRQLYYVYKQPASPQVQAFLGYVNSPQGQQAIQTIE